MLSASDLVEGLRLGDSHRGGIRCLILGRVDPGLFGALASEVATLMRMHRPSRPCDPEHVTNWAAPAGDIVQFSLWNRSGDTSDFADDHRLDAAGKAFRLQGCPLLGELAGSLPDLVNLRLNGLGPGASLGAHEEHVFVRLPDRRAAIKMRLHLPVFTDPSARLALDGHVFHLAEDLIHLVNHGCVHSAANDGASVRVHLVWDMLLTKRSFEALFRRLRLGPIDLFEPFEPEPVNRIEVGPFRRLSGQVPRSECDSVALADLIGA